ncbi:phosphotransferase [Trinickia caryophylli]|uniref:Phosphotransferase enzyme family protein n=1 Tax=Trinickia caryophylli TaxID=28094 RepID=A0A1X7CDY7_TRICW|nr:phosphotransferase [Trinickia caryophylli]PMS12574.1 aminoglycoside phosphotransferase [Trinickia caryophylli]TRX19779.1 phosphotransferase [Trinickia caryophylli]WQE12895.1 phosphotransferase [Trinickia caryophylli]SME95063.1 Phosphotransferase enzyme family protein [Trinickia caryophylli]GLU30621.1 aminoglycoside phosphotransferase [Trinickia caryophylli]
MSPESPRIERDGSEELAADSAAAPLQFGVAGEQAERDWPLITHDALVALFGRYEGIGAPAKFLWHSPRPFSAAALVAVASGRTLFVKRHHRLIRDVEGLAEEHRFMAHLRSRGMPLAEVLAEREGDTAVTMGEWTYEVHTAAPGVDAYRAVMSWKPFFHRSHARAAGRALAELHRAARGYDAPARKLQPLLSSFRVLASPDLFDALERWVVTQPLLAAALATRRWREDIAQAIAPWHARLAPLLPALEPLWTHGDWHASNLIWSGSADGAEVGTILDFGLCDRTCAVYDLALAIERNAIDWLAPAHARQVCFEHIDALLGGYESVMPLAEDAYAALVAMLPIVHTEFALSEVAYFDGILASPATADVAYDGYLLGHARWFLGDDGQRLLAWLASRRATPATDSAPGGGASYSSPARRR